jgi:hypothetical protein
MFVLGHVGIGRVMLGRSRWTIPAGAFVLGALLPDLLDKTLYYSQHTSYATGTRTFGHTGLFLCAVAGVAALSRSRVWSAVAIGVATHLALDCFVDLFNPDPSSAWMALTWPFLHTRFAPAYFHSPFDQLHEIWTPVILISEITGAALLVREYWLYKRRVAILEQPERRPDCAGGVRPEPIVGREE